MDVPNPWVLRPRMWSLSRVRGVPSAYVFGPEWIEVRWGSDIDRRPAHVRALELELVGDGDIRSRAQEQLVVELYDGSSISIGDVPPGVRVIRSTLSRCYLTSGDRGARSPVPIEPRFFARGSRHPFGWYFDGELSIEVEGLDDVSRFLHGCRFQNDHAGDQWRHPVEMERFRFGDCEDHALWAWRRLVELGFDAELVVGRRTGWHAWVHVTLDGERHLFETTLKSEPMLWPLAEKLGEYEPHYGVDGTMQTYLYGRRSA